MPPDRPAIERQRMNQANWKHWGPYLSERQWGTVREDYSESGAAWDYFPHDQARSRAYRWGEDGLGGFCDRRQLLCLSVVLWNGQDPILKERLFGLTNQQGNHGEDVKELYYYLDATPTYSYARMLYKYPHAAYPYQRLLDENRRRGKLDPEFELLDTGIFADNRYFDVEIEYAKADAEDILLHVTAHNRGPEAARLHVLPQLWFRNTWDWFEQTAKPSLRAQGDSRILVAHPAFDSPWVADYDGPRQLLFCENATHVKRIFGKADAPAGYFKDAFHDYLIRGQESAVNPRRTGTKAAGWFVLEPPAGGRQSVRMRLRRGLGDGRPFGDFGALLAARQREAEAFYAELQGGIADADTRLVQRQALAGLLWSKQFYYYDIPQWLDGDPGQPPPPESRRHGRNSDWRHLNNADVLSMPDKWEYPWFAAWDLAFQCVALALVDPHSAKEQLILLCREWYMDPNGQLPAYEWNFGDVNPPVHAWAAWKVYQADRDQNGGVSDLPFLERVFHKLMLNFTWWVNRKDPEGRNIFQGGFLGLDNIGAFDRSKPLPTGGFIDQADGTAWMAMYSLNLTRIALELSRHNPVYEDIATKFFEHFLHIAAALNNLGDQGIGLWDEQDGFFYDVLRLPDGQKMPLRVRSMVGLIPLFAVEVIAEDAIEGLWGFNARLKWFLNYRPDLAKLVSHWERPGQAQRRLLSLVRVVRLQKLLRRMLDENEFLSPYGIRALSRYHLDHPYRFECEGASYQVRYRPGESDSELFGGNSNWRGPVWMPVNYLLIQSLRRFDRYYGDGVKVECPTGSGTWLTLGEVADELCRRLGRLFLRDADGRRPVFGASETLQNDPFFKDHVLFYEYFHGDDGRGIGASHQTGWTALIANLINEVSAPA
ncbi:MAG: glucosidase [Candidatus Competibacteraceae bacterium]|nr:glucosidase [Candidatus Competibacteraceae bacterium]